MSKKLEHRLEGRYLINFKNGSRSEGYVFTPDDIENGGWVDIDPENAFETREEAERMLAQAQAYCTEKGYENISLRLEKCGMDRMKLSQPTNHKTKET